MGKIVYFDQTGEPEVLKVGQVKNAEPKPSEVLIRHTAIGVNYFDVLLRKGQILFAGEPKICGMEAAGVIEKLGSETEGFKVGQRVAYGTAFSGAYSEYRCIDTKYLIAIPDTVDDKIVAASLTKGLTAHMLAQRVFIVREGVAVLIHSAAGGVGQILSQWCRHLGALVLGTVSSEDKEAIAAENCHYVFNRSNQAWVEQVRAVTKGIGVNAVYDAIGKDTFKSSLECLMPLGLMVLYGQTSGKVETIDIDLLLKKSLFFTYPTVFDYKAHRLELILSAEEIFRMIQNNQLKINIAAEFSLSEAAKAHKLLESKTAGGSIILIP